MRLGEYKLRGRVSSWDRRITCSGLVVQAGCASHVRVG